jgi:hypothetical protein
MLDNIKCLTFWFIAIACAGIVAGNMYSTLLEINEFFHETEAKSGYRNMPEGQREASRP